MLLGLTDPEEIIEEFHNMGIDTIALKLRKDGCMVSKDNIPFELENILETDK